MLPKVDMDSLDARDPEQIDRVFRRVFPWLERYFRAEFRGLERIVPGPALYVANHSGGLLTPDTFLLGGAIYRAHGLAEIPYGLGHEWAINLPVIRQILSPFGVLRACHENAHRVFERGHKALVYPGGDFDDFRPFRHRHRIVFGGRRGYIRLALQAGVPIIPVVTAGAHSALIILDDLRWLPPLLGIDKRIRIKAWPLSLMIPWGLTVLPPLIYLPAPVKVLMEVLEPIRFERSGPEAVTDEAYVEACAQVVETQMQTTLTRLAEERRARRRELLGQIDPTSLLKRLKKTHSSAVPDL